MQSSNEAQHLSQAASSVAVGDTASLAETQPIDYATGGLDGRVGLSFEFFPPKTEKATEHLWRSVLQLSPLSPRFVSVTYGAGGSTRKRTHDTVLRIQNEVGIQAAAHLTCVRATRDEIDEIARYYWNSGIRHIVALRGDPPGGVGERYEPWPGGYGYADSLVAGLRRIADFEISVAAYPETHPQARNVQDDMTHLKRKFDLGATRAITQFFFDPGTYFAFADRVKIHGIKGEIVPGIMPIGNFAKAQQFAGLCGASIPPWLVEHIN